MRSVVCRSVLRALVAVLCVMVHVCRPVQESLEQLSLDAEDKPVDEMWRQGGGATHDLPDHAATRTP